MPPIEHLRAFILVALLSTLGALPATGHQGESAADHLRYESDDPASLVLHAGYVLRLDTITIGLDTLRLAARWSVHLLTPGQILGRSDRPTTFRADPLFDRRFQAHHDDYTHRGYDRGHIVPAADFGDGAQKRATFLVTNIAPQTPALNRGPWKVLEEQTRDLVSESDRPATVVAGVIYGSGAKVFRFRSDRGEKLAVPEYFYKIIYVDLGHEYLWFGRRWLWAFVFPHSFVYPDESLACFQVSLDEIEEITGEVFFEALPEKEALSSVVMPAQWLAGASCER